MTHHVRNPHATDELVIVLETTDPALAAVAESILEEDGLVFNPQGDALEGALGMAAGPIRLQVLKQDEERAKELLRDLI